MEKTVLKAYPRVGEGSSSAKKLRREGKVPATMYGSDIESQNIVLMQNEITKFVAHHGSGAKVYLDIDGKEEMAIIKQLQRSTVKKDIIHVEFLHLNAGEKIKVALPVTFTGEEKINSKYVIQKLVHELEVEVLPKDLVDNIEIEIGHLDLNDSILLKDIDLSNYPGIELIDDEDTMVVSVSEPQNKEEKSEDEEDETEGIAVEPTEEV